MKVIFRLVFIFISVQAFSLSFWDDKPPEVLAVTLVQNMTDEELAGQVFMFSFPSDDPSPNFLSWIQNRSLGGVKIFGWNATSPQAVAKAVLKIQKSAQYSRFAIPLLVATDQEGGWVRHIKGSTSQTSGNLALGSSGLAHDSWETGYFIGRELSQMGVNMNFAPSVDLYLNPDAQVIGPRSFSQDPVQAGWLAIAFVQGLIKARVIPTAKHYPGHGNTSADSHGKLPILKDSLETLRHREFIPYQMLFKDGLPALMTGHLAFPEITGDLIPASLNPKLNKQIIRDEMKFSGVVITDDLYMEGARPAGWDYQITAIKALQAGNDMLLLSQPANAQDLSWQAVVYQLRNDREFKKNVQDSARRILELKLKFLKDKNRVPLFPDSNALQLPDSDGQKFFLSQTIRSTVFLKNKNPPWPADDGEGILAVAPYGTFFDTLKKFYPKAQTLEYDYNVFSYDRNFAQLLGLKAKTAKRILFLAATPGAYGLLKVLEPYNDKLALLSVLSPVPLKDYPWIKTAIAIFGANPEAFAVGVAAIQGQFTSTAKLPLHFNGLPQGGGS